MPPLRGDYDDTDESYSSIRHSAYVIMELYQKLRGINLRSNFFRFLLLLPYAKWRRNSYPEFMDPCCDPDGLHLIEVPGKDKWKSSVILIRKFYVIFPQKDVPWEKIMVRNFPSVQIFSP